MDLDISELPNKKKNQDFYELTIGQIRALNCNQTNHIFNVKGKWRFFFSFYFVNNLCE